MLRVLVLFPSLLFLLYVVDTKFVIDLYRQKTPRASMMETADIPEHEIWLDWLKKPHKDNRTNDTIPLLRFLDTEYYALIYVGSPGKPMKVLFDTAWTATWIMSNDCPIRKIGCWFHNKYKHKISSTYVKDGRSFISAEGTYNLTGYYSRDELKLGHTTVNQTFVEMTDLPYWYVFSRADGVIGLGLPYGNINPFISNVLSQTNITNPIFSIYLNRDKSSNKGGSIILGEIDKKHIHVTEKVPDRITYVPINAGSPLWEFNMDAVYLKAGTKTSTICKGDCVGLGDTTSNSIITTPENLKEINEEISAKPFAFGKFEVECNTVNKLPFLIFVIGGTNFTLIGTDYTQKISVGPFTVCISAITASSTTPADKRWVLGGAFFSKYYSIYDIQNKQVGLVRAA